MYILGNWKDRLDVKSSAELAGAIAANAAQEYANIMNKQLKGDNFPKNWQTGAVAYIYLNKGKKTNPR